MPELDPEIPDFSEVEWHPESRADDLRALVASLSTSRVELIKKNRCRIIFRVASEKGCFYIKCDHPHNVRDLAKSLWRGKAEIEYRSGKELAAAGVPVVEMIGWGKHGANSYVVSREAPDALEMNAFWETCQEDPQQRASYLHGLTVFLGKMLTSRVIHPDLHPGNVLVIAENGDATFLLVDVYGVTTKQGALTQLQEREIIELPASLDEMRPQELTRIYNELRADMTISEETTDIVVRKFSRYGRKWPRRKWRFTKVSSLCHTAKDTHGCWTLLHSLEHQLAQQLVENHRANIAQKQNLVKVDRKRSISRAFAGSQSYIVKEFSNVKLPGALRTDRTSWLNHHHLSYLGIRVCQCFGWLNAGGQGFLILEDLGNETTLQYLSRVNSRTERRALLESVAHVAAQLHVRGVFHRDLTLANIMVSHKENSSEYSLVLIDVDRMRFYSQLPPELRRHHNLSQVLELLQSCGSRSEGLRFLANYRLTMGKESLANDIAIRMVEEYWPLSPS